MNREVDDKVAVAWQYERLMLVLTELAIKEIFSRLEIKLYLHPLLRNFTSPHLNRELPGKLSVSDLPIQ